MYQGTLFESNEAFKGACIETLASLVPLIERGSDVMLLNTLCANTYFDQALKEQLGGPFRNVFVEMVKRYRDALSHGQQVQAPDEDFNVFLRMALVGVQNLKLTERKKVDVWDVQFNQIRYFRPRRKAGKPATGPLNVSFEIKEFHYDRRDVDREVAWTGELCGKSADVILNQYPFLHLHCLLVPERSEHHAQYLTADLHHWTWAVFQSLLHVEGIAGGYNSLKSFASVNHFHVQMFADPAGLPVDDVRWSHNGGVTAYPATVSVFDTVEQSWAWIEKAHRHDIPYNLLYVPGRIYCFGRENQGAYSQPSFTSGFAFCEMSGSFITFNKQDYDALTERDYTGALGGIPCPEPLRGPVAGGSSLP